MWNISISLIVIALGLFFIFRKRRLSIFKRLGIPGPEPNLLIGNLYAMIKTNPLKCHDEWIKKYGKVVGIYQGALPMLIVADIELAKQILIKDFHKFANRPFFRNDSDFANFFPNELISLTNKRWKEVRSIITPTFTTSKMRMMTPLINGAVDSLMSIIDRHAKSGSTFEVYQLYQRLTLDVIGRSAFGIQTDVQNKHDDVILRALKVLIGVDFKNTLNILFMTFPEFGKLWKYVVELVFLLQSRGQNPVDELLDQCKHILKLRRENKEARRQDFLQIMMDASISEASLKNITDENLASSLSPSEGEKFDESEAKETSEVDKNARYMTNEEIIDNCVLFLIAGYDTTSAALAFATHFLLHYPEMQEKIRSEVRDVARNGKPLDYNSVHQLKFLDQFMMESLRIYPPICLFESREAEEDVQYENFMIPKGMAVQIPVFHINRDPELWPDPLAFNPDRFSPENRADISAMSFQTFGVGPRNCVGMRFAQLEMKLALARILNNYKLVPVEETDKEPLPLSVGAITISPTNGIKLKAIPI